MTFDLKRNALQGAGGLPGVRDCHIMAKFFPLKVTKEAITAVEYEDPFEHMKMFGLVGVESKALTLEDVPQEYRPYQGCLFVSGQCYSAGGGFLRWILCKHQQDHNLFGTTVPAGSLYLQGVVTYTLPVEAFATGIKNLDW